MRRSIRLHGLKAVTKPNGRRYFYRRVRGGLVPLPDLPTDDPRFLAAWVAAEAATPPDRATAPEGSIAAAIVAFQRSDHWRALSLGYRRPVAAHLDTLRQKYGGARIEDLEPRHIRADLDTHSGARNNRLKAWRTLCAWAVERGLIESNPARLVRPSPQKGPGFRRITPPEIAAFRAHWEIGTPQRGAFELIYWTGARCVDARGLGWQMVGADGWLSFTQSKTGGRVEIPFTTPMTGRLAWLEPDRQMMLEALGERHGMIFIRTRTGAPRSQRGLSQWMAAAMQTVKGVGDDASAHGLRKARAAELAEAGWSEHQIGAWTGHESFAEIRTYTRSARKRLLLSGTDRDQILETAGNSFPDTVNSQTKTNT